MQYTPQTAADHILSKFSRLLRFAEGEVQELTSNVWVEADETRLTHYAQIATQDLISHAMVSGGDAIAEAQTLIPQIDEIVSLVRYGLMQQEVN